MVQSALKKKSSGNAAHTSRVRAPQKRKVKSTIERVAKKAMAKSVGIIERSLAQQALRHHAQKPMKVVKPAAAADAAEVAKQKKFKAKAKRVTDGMKKPDVIVPQQFNDKQRQKPADE